MDNAALITNQWTNMQVSSLTTIRPLISEAAGRAELRALYPYTSHDTLCFSRTVGYPFSNDCPSAEPVANLQFLANLQGFEKFMEHARGDEAHLTKLRSEFMQTLAPQIGELGAQLEETGDGYNLRLANGTLVGSGDIARIQKHIEQDIPPRFRVRTAKGRLIGVGGVGEAIEMLVRALQQA